MSRYTHVLRSDQQCRAPWLYLFQGLRVVSSSIPFEHIELPAKLLDYFLRSNKSNINQFGLPVPFIFLAGKSWLEWLTPPRNFERMGMRMGIHGEWQKRNDLMTICECHSPKGKGNNHRWPRVFSFGLSHELIVVHIKLENRAVLNQPPQIKSFGIPKRLLLKCLCGQTSFVCRINCINPYMMRKPWSITGRSPGQIDKKGVWNIHSLIESYLYPHITFMTMMMRSSKLNKLNLLWPLIDNYMMSKSEYTTDLFETYRVFFVRIIGLCLPKAQGLLPACTT